MSALHARTFATSSVVRLSVPLVIRNTPSASRWRAPSATTSAARLPNTTTSRAGPRSGKRRFTRFAGRNAHSGTDGLQTPRWRKPIRTLGPPSRTSFFRDRRGTRGDNGPLARSGF